MWLLQLLYSETVRSAARHVRSPHPAFRQPPADVPSRDSLGFLAAVACIGALLVAGFAWAYSSPIGSSPDDDFHQSSIWCPYPLEDSGCRLVYDDAGVAVGAYVPEIVRYASKCFAFQPEQSATCVDDLDATLVASDRIDRGDYPGLYYEVMRIFVGEDPVRSILVMRFFNATLAVLLLSAVAATMPRVGHRLMVLALVGTAVPLNIFLIASVNPSSWAIVGVAVAWLSSLALATSDTTRRTVAAGVLVVAGAALAAASRSDAAAYVLVALVAMAILTWRDLRRRPLLLAVPVVAGALCLASYFSAAQRTALVTGFEGDSDRNPDDVLFHNLTELPSLLAGLSGGFKGLGWFDTAMPAITHISVVAVVAGLVLNGLRAMWPEKFLSLALLATALTVLPLLVLQGSLSKVGEAVQPRYLLPLVFVAIATALVGRPRSGSPGLTTSQTVAVYTLLVLANSFGLHANIRRYVTGQDVLSFNLGQNAEWWWSFGPSPMEVWAIGSAAFAVGALLLFHVRESARPEASERAGMSTVSTAAGDRRRRLPPDGGRVA